ncbi:MAG: tryptophan 7-halogenase [Planctomycetia bacterium]|nr:tryptophan 7-halogenase [Planctomycetia bacterium]
MSSSLYDADLLVLGGGPAGSAAAITAVDAGLTAIIIEREEFPRPAPGESVHPGIQPLLRQLGVETEVLDAGFLRHPGYLVRAAASEQYVPFGEDADGPWLGFQLWRPDFDAILLVRARAVGVSVMQPVTATGLIFDHGKIAGVTTSQGSLRARHVIDATGRWRAVARWLNLAWQRHGPVRRAWYGYASGRCADRDDIPLFAADVEGWTWIARVRADTFAWTRLNFDGTRPPHDWLPPELVKLEPVGTTHGADVTSEVVRQTAGAGYFLVGDAAAVLDPAAGHGLLKALMSGIQSGHLLSNMIRGAVPAEAAADHYSSWVHNWFQHDIAELNARYARF